MFSHLQLPTLERLQAYLIRNSSTTSSMWILGTNMCIKTIGGITDVHNAQFSVRKRCILCLFVFFPPRVHFSPVCPWRTSPSLQRTCPRTCFSIPGQFLRGNHEYVCAHVSFKCGKNETILQTVFSKCKKSSSQKFGHTFSFQGFYLFLLFSIL